MKDIREILIDLNDSMAGCSDRYSACLEDIEFANVPGAQWRGSDSRQFKNRPKPENNKIARMINRVLGQYQRMELNAKIIAGSDDASDDDAELLQARWRNDFQATDGVEALNNAAFEAFYGGFGAVRLQAVYDDEEEPDDDYQHICVKPVWSAASSVFFNAGSIRKDKADATQAWHISRVNRKYTEKEFGVSIASVNPSVDYFDWCTDSTKDVYIAHYYEVIEKKIRTYTFGDMKITRDGRKLFDAMGERVEQEDFDEMKDLYPDYEESTRKVKEVWYALMSGDQFLEKPRKTPFKRIPIIPQYGYHCVINGIEHFCGEVARQRDNQRFSNMIYGAMMEIAGQPQVEKELYAPEQVQRYSQMHQNDGIENYPYLLVDPITDKEGSIIHAGPLGKKTAPQIGTGLATAIQFVEQNVLQQGGSGQSTLPSNVSGHAVQQINDRADDSYETLFQNACQTIRAACECWIPGAQKLYFSNERRLRIMALDGKYSSIMTMQYGEGPDGSIGPYKNTGRGRYDVLVRAGESYKTQKQEEKQNAMELLQYASGDTEMGQMALTSAILATPGEGTENMRKIAQVRQWQILISMGLTPEVKTDEERAELQMVVQRMQQQQMAMAQQQQQMAQQTMMAEGQARLMEGRAALMNEKNDADKNAISMLKVQNDFARTEIEAAKAGVDITGKQIDNARKLMEPLRNNGAIG